MNPHVQRKLYLEELQKKARVHFLRLIENKQIPEDEARRIISGVHIARGRSAKSVTLVVSLLPSKGPKINESGYPIDNHWDTKDLCRLEIDKETAKITVTIINEMPWLRHDMLTSDTVTQ